SRISSRLRWTATAPRRTRSSGSVARPSPAPRAVGSRRPCPRRRLPPDRSLLRGSSCERPLFQEGHDDAFETRPLRSGFRRCRMHDARGETERLNGWFQGLGVGFGDTIYVDGAYGSPAASQVAQVAGRYGMMVQPGAPVTEGVVQPGTVRVVVSRRRAEVPGCPNWSRPAQPNFENKNLSNYGCGVNSNLAAMVADPVDLLRGRDGTGVSDAVTAAKAVGLYRTRPPSGSKELKESSSKGGN